MIDVPQPKKGDSVRAKEDFMITDMVDTEVRVPTGELGMVISVDGDGDATIKFDFHEHTILLAKNSCNLIRITTVKEEEIVEQSIGFGARVAPSSDGATRQNSIAWEDEVPKSSKESSLPPGTVEESVVTGSGPIVSLSQLDLDPASQPTLRFPASPGVADSNMENTIKEDEKPSDAAVIDQHDEERKTNRPPVADGVLDNLVAANALQTNGDSVPVSPGPDAPKDQLRSAGDSSVYVFAPREQPPDLSVRRITCRDRANAIVQMQSFEHIIMGFIILNVFTMTMDGYPPAGPSLVQFLMYSNYVFTAVFALECLLYHIAWGPCRYWRNLASAFDGFIVFVSLIEPFLPNNGGGAATQLRALRLLRIFKLAKKIASFRILVRSMYQTLIAMGHFSVVLLLTMLVFTLMGMNFFATKFRFEDVDGDRRPILDDSTYCPNDFGDEKNLDCIPRAHFDEFLWAFVTCFQIFSGENWNTVMYDAMLLHWAAVFFFLAIIVVGQLIILNLFLAMLMYNFEKESGEIRQKEKANRKREAAILAKLSENKQQAAKGPGLKDRANTLTRTLSQQFSTRRSFLLFDPDSGFRKFARHVCQMKSFDNFILILIALSSFTMLIENPLADPNAPLFHVLQASNWIFTTIFTLEMLVKKVAHGVIFGKNAYWRSGWNILDGIVVIIALVDALNIGGNISAIKTLRVLRALRPLRMISRNENLKLVVQTLMESLPELCNLLVVAGLFFLVFALFSVTYFQGGFYTCKFADGGDVSEFEFWDLNRTKLFDDVTPLCIDTNSNSSSFGHVWPQGVSIAGVFLINNSGCEAPGSDAWVAYESSGAALPPPPSSAVLRSWQRPTADTSVCDAGCEALPNEDESLRSERCPGPILGYEQIPDVGKHGYGVEGVDPDEYPEWISAATRWVMPCASIDFDDGTHVAGCEEHFCSGNMEPSADLKAVCEDTCHPLAAYCQDSCSADSSSTGCKECRRHCEAACQCDMYCSAFYDDAGVCVEQSGMWLNMNQHFDNTWAGILSLFEISTTEGWVDVMYAATDRVGPMKNPQRDYAVGWSLYFVVFIFFGTFFILNLCVGVICDKFGEMKVENGSVMLTDTQKRYQETCKILEYEKLLFGVTNLNKLSPSRKKMYFWIGDPKFEAAIVAAILLNTTVMAVKVFPAPNMPGLESALEVINYCFAAIFFLEAGCKMHALRGNYFKDSWNRFDFICVLSTLIGVLLILFDMNVGSVMGAIRLFRIVRLFRLLRFAEGLNKLFTTFINSIPKLINVAMILGLLLFLFSVMGVHMFSKVHMHGTHNVHANFRTFPRAVLTLLRSMTGEGWNEIMHSLSKDARFFGHSLGEPCIPDMDITAENFAELERLGAIENPVQCGNGLFAQVFFVAYTCLITFVILNLFVAVVLEAFLETPGDGDKARLMAMCVQVWKDFDPSLQMKLTDIKTVQAFIEKVLSRWSGQQDFKFDLQKAKDDVQLLKMEPDGSVLFKNAVLAVIRLDIPKGDLADVDQIHSMYVAPPDEIDPEGLPALNDIQAQLAACRLQEVYRAKRARRKIEDEEAAMAGPEVKAALETRRSTVSAMIAQSSPTSKGGDPPSLCGSEDGSPDKVSIGLPPPVAIEAPQSPCTPTVGLPGEISENSPRRSDEAPHTPKKLEEKRGEPDVAG